MIDIMFKFLSAQHSEDKDYLTILEVQRHIISHDSYQRVSPPALRAVLAHKELWEFLHHSLLRSLNIGLPQINVKNCYLKNIKKPEHVSAIDPFTQSLCLACPVAMTHRSCIQQSELPTSWVICSLSTNHFARLSAVRPPQSVLIGVFPGRK